jgi:undecaprenyl pyrophosphate phosphatase UppP
MIPAVFGATLFEARDLEPGAWQWTYLAGVVASFVVGVAALAVLRAWVTRGALWVFGVYCAAVAVVGLATA